MSVAAPPAPSPGKSRWVCGWAQGVDSVREILSVRASPRLCQNPAKLPAEEEAAAAAAARVPLRARPAPRCAPADRRAADPGPADAARRWIRAAHQQTTSGRWGEKRKKKKRRKGRKGSGEEGEGGGVHYSKPRSSTDERQQLCWKEQSVRVSPPSAQTL